jgi:peptide deformylase
MVSKLGLVKYPDDRLNEVCDAVPVIDGQIEALAADMIETMVASNGVGLAAPQIGQNIRLFVVDIWWPDTKDASGALVFINPTILMMQGKQRGQEGCLSLPGLYEYVDRAQTVKIQAKNVKGETFEIEADEFLARAIQHEYDHLDGILTLDRMGALARKMALKKLRRQ